MENLNFEHYKNRLLSKTLSSKRITDIYPMIDRIDAYDVPMVDITILRIYVKDHDLTNKNMYQRGFDPHYLIDHHLKIIAPYLSIPKTQRYGFVILSPNGQLIDSYI